MTIVGVYYCDLAAEDFGASLLEFTFFWTEANHWEGRNFTVAPA